MTQVKTIVVKNRIRAVASSMIAAAEAASIEGARAHASRARELAPVGDADAGHPPGTLRDSIEADGQVAHTTGVANEYASIVEHGSRFMSAEPFWAPAEAEGKRAAIAAGAALPRIAAERAARSVGGGGLSGLAGASQIRDVFQSADSAAEEADSGSR